MPDVPHRGVVAQEIELPVEWRVTEILDRTDPVEASASVGARQSLYRFGCFFASVAGGDVGRGDSVEGNTGGLVAFRSGRYTGNGDSRLTYI